MAVSSRQEGLDPVGATVGQRGGRVQAVVAELGGEKIDIIPWADDPDVFVANALSPAQVVGVKIDEPNRIAAVTVPERMLSLAIGREGQNARLAAKLTGWRIDIRSENGPRPEDDAPASPPQVVAEPEPEVEPEARSRAEDASPRKPSRSTRPPSPTHDDVGRGSRGGAAVAGAAVAGTRHVPARTCVACRTRRDKAALVRIVRRPDGRVVLDHDGRLEGRGAYLCADGGCWALALRRSALQRALRSRAA